MGDSDPKATFSYVIESLNQFNLAYLHLMEATEADIRHGGNPISIFDFRPLYQGLLMANSGYDKDTANAAIASGKADLVSFGKLFVANPDLPKRFQLNAPLNEPDSSRFYGGDEKGYTDYPFLDSTDAA